MASEENDRISLPYGENGHLSVPGYGKNDSISRPSVRPLWRKRGCFIISLTAMTSPMGKTTTCSSPRLWGKRRYFPHRDRVADEEKDHPLLPHGENGNISITFRWAVRKTNASPSPMGKTVIFRFPAMGKTTVFHVHLFVRFNENLDIS